MPQGKPNIGGPQDSLGLRRCTVVNMMRAAAMQARALPSVAGLDALVGAITFKALRTSHETAVRMPDKGQP